MSMYPPLEFVERVENFIPLQNKSRDAVLVNNMALEFAEDFLAQNRSKLYHDLKETRHFSKYRRTEKIIDFYTKVQTDFSIKLGINDFFQVQEFMALLLSYDVRSVWRKNKLSYLIDNELFKTLITMEPLKSISLDCLTKLPANCFYIDYGGMGSEFMEGLDGSFVTAEMSDGELNLIMVNLYHESDGKEFFFMTGSDAFSLSTDKYMLEDYRNDKREFVGNDGIKRSLRLDKLVNFMYNFAIYLQASNRDVEISERTRQNHTKPVQTIKNKFREVKEFEVGFVYGRTIGKDRKRVKYVGEAEGTGVHSPKASHYRSAHWHHYWVGSGDDKRLVIKWIEGIFVKGNGDEAKNIRVCKVV